MAIKACTFRLAEGTRGALSLSLARILCLAACARQEALHAARATMAGIFDRPPEFTDLTVADEWTG